MKTPANRVFLLTIFSFCFSGPILSQTAINLLGQRSYSNELNDVWGYVDGNGREYALVGTTHGVSIVDLLDPTQPTQLHFIPGAVSDWRDLKTYGAYAYVSNEEDDGTLIIDLSGLPASIAWKDTVMEGARTAHNLWIDQDQLYLVGTNTAGGGMLRFDLGPDPWHPAFVGQYDEHYVHDVYVRNDTAYAAEISSGFLTIIDWTDPTNPVTLSNTTYPDAFTHNTWLNDQGDVCFTTDEIANGFIYAWDVSDPSNPALLDGIRSSLSPGAVIPHNVHVINDYLVTSYYRDGIQVVDAARPANLVEVGNFDTSPFENFGFNGAWGAYPFLPSGLILVSDIEEGLFVLQPSYQRACYLEGTTRDEVLGFPVANVDITLLGDSATDQSRTNGSFGLGTAVSGQYAVAFSKFGYFPDTLLVDLNNGLVTYLDVDLLPEARVPLTITVLDAVTQDPISGAQVQLEAASQRATFQYTTISTGEINDPLFTINNYHLLVGKWGYLPQADTILIDSSQAQITVYLQPGYYDDFSLDLGWEVSGTAERGQWVREEPVGSYRENGDIYNPEADLPDDFGDQCYVTGNGDPLPFGTDVDNGYTWLVSPPMDLSNYLEPVIEYHWWFLNWSLENGGRPANDFLAVSITDGIDTFALKTYQGPFDTLWNHETSFYFLKYFPDLSQPLRVLFYTQDFEPGNQDAVEAAIDGFRVVEAATSSLAEDTFPGRAWISATSDQSALLGWEDLPPGSWVTCWDLQGRKLIEQQIPSSGGHMDLPFPHSPGWYLLRWGNGHHFFGQSRWLFRR